MLTALMAWITALGGMTGSPVEMDQHCTADCDCVILEERKLGRPHRMYQLRKGRKAIAQVRGKVYSTGFRARGTAQSWDAHTEASDSSQIVRTKIDWLHYGGCEVCKDRPHAVGSFTADTQFKLSAEIENDAEAGAFGLTSYREKTSGLRCYASGGWKLTKQGRSYYKWSVWGGWERGNVGFGAGGESGGESSLGQNTNDSEVFGPDPNDPDVVCEAAKEDLSWHLRIVSQVRELESGADGNPGWWILEHATATLKLQTLVSEAKWNVWCPECDDHDKRRSGRIYYKRDLKDPGS